VFSLFEILPPTSTFLPLLFADCPGLICTAAQFSHSAHAASVISVDFQICELFRITPSDILGEMPLSNRRRARRKELQLQETSDAEAPDSSPTRPSAKKRKVSPV
jgi:hypothetical protein